MIDNIAIWWGLLGIPMSVLIVWVTDRSIETEPGKQDDHDVAWEIGKLMPPVRALTYLLCWAGWPFWVIITAGGWAWIGITELLWIVSRGRINW